MSIETGAAASASANVEGENVVIVSSCHRVSSRLGAVRFLKISHFSCIPDRFSPANRNENSAKRIESECQN
jgi:hypothetical protein